MPSWCAAVAAGGDSVCGCPRLCRRVRVCGMPLVHTTCWQQKAALTTALLKAADTQYDEINNTGKLHTIVHRPGVLYSRDSKPEHPHDMTCRCLTLAPPECSQPCTGGQLLRTSIPNSTGMPVNCACHAALHTQQAVLTPMAMLSAHYVSVHAYLRTSAPYFGLVRL